MLALSGIHFFCCDNHEDSDFDSMEEDCKLPLWYTYVLRGSANQLYAKFIEPQTWNLLMSFEVNNYKSFYISTKEVEQSSPELEKGWKKHLVCTNISVCETHGSCFSSLLFAVCTVFGFSR